MNIKKNVYLMYVIVFLQGFVFYGPVATLYRQARGLSMAEIFIIESILMVLMILFEVPWGWVADRIGYKKAIIISNFIFFISKIIFFKAYSFEMFLLERVLLAIALAGLSGCDTALLYASCDKENSQKVFGTYSACSNGGFLIASLVSTFIISASMDMTGFLTIIPYGIAVVLSFFLVELEAEKHEKRKLKNSFRSAFKNTPLIMLVLSFALAREVVQAVTVFLNQGQYIKSGIDIKYFGVLVALVQIVRLSSVKAQSLSDKFGKEKSIRSLYLIITLGCIAMIFTVSPLLSILSVVFIAFSMSLIEPMVVDIQNKSISTGDRATMLSIYAMTGDVSAALVNPVIGWAADISIAAAFKVCVLVCVIVLCLFLFYTKKQGRVSPN